MAVKIVKTVFQFRRATAEEWLLNKDVIPAAGEPCFVIDKNILKIGDGKTTFENLEPINGVKFEIEADGKSVVLEDNTLKLMGFDAAEVGAQPRKTANGIEWVVPSTETVDGLKSAVTGLQSDVTKMQATVTELRDIVMPSGEEGAGTLLDRVESLESKVGNEDVDAKIDAKINEFAAKVSADGTVNTLKELIDYVADHGPEAANMAADIKALRDLVGTTSVNDQIIAIVNDSEKKARATFEHVKYEIADTPAGTIVDYGDKEIRVMVPANAKFVKQAVGAGGDANSYYMTFKTYAPSDDVVGYIEHLGDKVDNEILTNLAIDKYGRRYQPTWLAIAKYDYATDAWTYYGKNSTARKYIGWDYQIDWYNADGVMVASDCIRINLSNEGCHNVVNPYYMANVIKEVTVNGTLLDAVDGRVNINVPEIKGSDEIAVNEDGTLSIKTISFDKIVQDEDAVLVMDGGSAV